MTESYLKQFAAWLASLWPKVEAPLADPHRRTFLLAVSAAAAAGLLPTLDTEKLLWTPGQKTLFVPPAPEVFNQADMLAELAEFGKYSDGVNAFVTPQWVTREALRVLRQNLLFTKNINREYESSFAVPVGRKVSLRTPSRLAVREPDPYPVVKAGHGDYYQSVKYDPPSVGTFQSDVPVPDIHAEVVQHTPVHLAIEVTSKELREDPRGAAKKIGDGLAAELSKRGYADKIAAVGELELPVYVDQGCVATDARSGLSLRGMTMYDIQQDLMRNRFDLKIFV